MISLRTSQNGKAQGGFALLGVLGILVVLAILGTVVYQSVNTDITHSGKDLSRVRAEFAAESAAQWGLAELARKRGSKLPFTLATHTSDGSKPLPDGNGDGGHNDSKLGIGDVAMLDGAQGGVDEDGWIYQTLGGKELTVSCAKHETMAFKAYYPDDSTLHIDGRGTVDGNVIDVMVISHLGEVAVPK